MRAATVRRYGPPEVVQVESLPRPGAGRGEILVEVRASTVTTADWRLRAAEFPPGLRLIGRLVSGLWRPRHLVPGVDFAGVVREVGAGVAGFSAGDRVFGACGHGAHAEWVAVPASGAVAPIPDGVSFAEAAALPFGAICAVDFVERFGAVRAGERVLVTGASGNVGSFAVQVAKAKGAHVTAVASRRNHPLLEQLGADRVLDYQTQDIARLGERFDAIVDGVGTFRFASARPLLSRGGRLLAIEGGVRELLEALWPWFRDRHRIVSTVSVADARALIDVAARVAAKTLRPVIERVVPLESIAEAHAHVEARHRAGVLILAIGALDSDQK